MSARASIRIHWHFRARRENATSTSLPFPTYPQFSIADLLYVHRDSDTGEALGYCIDTQCCTRGANSSGEERTERGMLDMSRPRTVRGMHIPGLWCLDGCMMISATNIPGRRAYPLMSPCEGTSFLLCSDLVSLQSVYRSC